MNTNHLNITSGKRNYLLERTTAGLFKLFGIIVDKAASKAPWIESVSCTKYALICFCKPLYKKSIMLFYTIKEKQNLSHKNVIASD